MDKLFLDINKKIDKFFSSSLLKISEEQKHNLKKDLILDYLKEDSSITFSISTKYFPKPLKLSFVQIFLKNLLGCIINNKMLIIDILIAVDEIVANILEHSYKKKGDVLIFFEFIFTKNKIIINIKDFGPYGYQMDISKFYIYNSKENFKKNFLKNKRGMGIHMIKKIMDQVKYETIPDKYNLLTLIKKIDKSSFIMK